MPSRRLNGPLGGDYLTDGAGNSVPVNVYPVDSDDQYLGTRLATAETDIVNLQATASVSTLRPIRRSLVTMGDSISDNISSFGPNSKSWAQGAAFLSGGEFWWEDSHGTGGYTSTQVLATHLPAVLARSPRPGFCAIMMGTNDSDNIATFKANYTAAFDALLSVGIIPVAGSLTPITSDATAQTKAHKYNTWLSRECVRRGIPFVNWMQDVVDQTTAGDWASGKSDDGTHPNVAGAKLMAQRCADVLTKYIRGEVVFDPYLACCNTDASCISQSSSVRNCLFLSDSNADGVANGWSLTNNGGAASTASRDDPTGSDALGKWQTLTRGGSDGSNLSRISTSNAWLSIPAGEVIQVAYRVKATLEAGSGNISLQVPNGPQGAEWPSQWSAFNIPAATKYLEYTPTTTANMNAFFDFNSGTGSLSVAQMTVRNLTNLGVV